MIILAILVGFFVGIVFTLIIDAFILWRITADGPIEISRRKIDTRDDSSTE